MRARHAATAALLLTIPLLLGNSGCAKGTSADVERSRAAQQDVMTNAQQAVPAYQPRAFPSREAINSHLQETEQPGVWYVYALSMTGEPVFYIVSEHRAMNLCTSITSPDRLVRTDLGGSWGNLVMSAPSMTGVYHGNANCNTFFVRDVTTSAIIEVSGGMMSFLSSRQPLFLETDVRRMQPVGDAAVPEAADG